MISVDKTISGKSHLQGFTMIEVMIVLSIAGLILAVILLAVPSLLRSHRTFQRRHDASFVLQERTEYETTRHPVPVTSPTSVICTPNPIDTNVGAFCDFIQTGLSFYTPDEVTIINNGHTQPTTIPVVGLHQVITESYLTCNDDGTAAVISGATPYSVAVIFAVETASGTTTQCLRSAMFTQP